MSLSLISQAYAIESDDDDCDKEQENRHEKSETSGGGVSVDDDMKEGLPEEPVPVVMTRSRGKNKKRDFKELPLNSNKTTTNFSKRKKTKRSSSLKPEAAKPLVKGGIGDNDDGLNFQNPVKPVAKSELSNSNGLPFTRCKIVLKLNAQPDSGSDGMGKRCRKSKTGWKREGGQFVFYEKIPPPCKTQDDKVDVANPKQTQGPETESSSPEPELKEEVKTVKRGRGRPRKEVKSSKDKAPKKGLVPPPGEMNFVEVEPEVKVVIGSDPDPATAPVNEEDKDGVIIQNQKTEIMEAVTPSIPLAYKCPFCFTKFGSSQDLIKHLPVHSTGKGGGSKPDGASDMDKDDKVEGRMNDKVDNNKKGSFSIGDPGEVSKPNEVTLDKPVVEVETPIPFGKGKKPSKRHPIKSKKSNYKCDSKDRDLGQHMDVHNHATATVKLFKCSSCPIYFRSLHGLQAHDMQVHKVDKQKVTMEGLGKEDPKIELANVTRAPVAQPDSTAGQPDKSGPPRKPSLPPTKSCTVNVTRCDDLLRKMKNRKARIRKKTLERKLPVQGRGNVPTSPSKPSEAEKSFPCGKCSQAFCYQSELSRHMVWAHFKINRIKKKKVEAKQGSRSRSRTAGASRGKVGNSKVHLTNPVKKYNNKSR